MLGLGVQELRLGKTLQGAAVGPTVPTMARRKRLDVLARETSNPSDNGAYQAGAKLVSDAFDSFYREQRLLPAGEWEAFFNCLRSDLPTAFRVVTVTPHRHYVLKFIKKTMESLQRLAPDGSPGEVGSHFELLQKALKPLRWYKSGNEAFQLDVSRYVLRTCEPLLGLHRFLVAQSEAATIYRQEAVSMIPALFLEKEMRGDSLVLDLCAAPGSKTSQLLEALHQAAERERRCAGSASAEWPALPTGAVVANDADSTRSHMLVHHLRHLHSPCLLVTSHAAQFFPAIFERLYDTEGADRDCLRTTGTTAAPGGQGESGRACRGTEPGRFVPIQFDGVLCDVPCSGDGTLRKARALWASWSPHQGLGCHRLQVQILLRGLKLCKVGGRVVYSTCAFNPIENEAVVLAAITASKGAVVLEDCTDELPGLMRRPGVSHWRVEWEGRWYDSFDQVPKTVKATKKLWPSMFPPGDQPERLAVPLHRCMRFFPHHNNTGGFFVAVMRKVRDVPVGPACNLRGDAVRNEANETLDRAEADGDFQDGVEEKEGAQDPIQEDSARILCGGRSKHFDKMQLDMIGLDWRADMLERQHQQQVRQQEERTQDKTDHQGGSTSPEEPEVGSSACPVHPSWPPVPTTQTLLEQTRELAFRTLDFPDPKEKRNEVNSELQALSRGLCSHLYFRRRTSDDCAPRSGNSSDAGPRDCDPTDRLPRRLFFVSEGVKRLVESTGASRYKIINGGTLAFQFRCKGAYRIAYGGAQWLAPFCESAERLGAAAAGGETAGFRPQSPAHPPSGASRDDLPKSVKRHVFHIPWQLLYKLVAAEDQQRVHLSHIENISAGDTVVRESSEGPLLFFSRVPRAVDGAGGDPTKVAVPAWRGRTNVELMLDPNTRWALKCLIEECGEYNKESTGPN